MALIIKTRKYGFEIFVVILNSQAVTVTSSINGAISYCLSNNIAYLIK